MKTKLIFHTLIVALAPLSSVPNIAAQTCIPAPPGMHSWFPGDANPQDILNNALDLSVTGTVAYAPGVVGNAFTFDGNSDVIYSNINAGSAYTVDFWVRPIHSSADGLRQHLVANTLAGTTAFGFITFDPLAQKIEYYQESASSITDAKIRSTPIAFDAWTHVTLTYDGQVNRLYLNGALVPQNPGGDLGIYGTSVPHSETFNNPIGIGNSVVPTDIVRFNGQIDEVEIFNRVLSVAEIQAIVNAGSAGKCKAPVDADGDGIVDGRDACPGTPSGTIVNASGCPEACFPPPAGMTNWFPGDGNVNDIQGGNNGTLNGGVTFPAGKVAQAFNFDGTGAVTYSNINAGSTYTVDFWVRPISSSSDGLRQELVSNTNAGSNFGTITIDSARRIEYSQGGVFGRVLSPVGAAPFNTYTHVALTYDGSVNRLYLNGNLVSTSTAHPETFNNPIAVGYGIATANARFVGQIDEVEIFSRALSQTEIRGIFYSDAAGKCKETIPGTLGNISTRLRVETGDNVLIGGFIVTGTQPKRIIVRAIGPSLPLAGALPDPTLELRDSAGGLIRANDNWRSDQEAEIIATTIPPGHNLESAIVATLPANGSAYTAIVRGANNGTGIGVVEVYDLDQIVDSTLANISTRGLVQTADNVLIAGTIVLGPAPQRVLIRAIGPSLPLAGKLENPTMELRDGNGALVRANDDWRSEQEAEIVATTIPPANDLESAIVATLPAGGAAYTAIVRGVNGTTGVAVVEVYNLR